MNPTELVSTPGILTTTTGNHDMSRCDIWVTNVAGKITEWKGEKLVEVYWSSPEKKEKRKVETDLRHIAEAELLELGHQQEYFGEMTTEKLNMISRFTA